ncbi:MAG: hypothetical protein L0Z50_09905 [Verrucomicrobiales bacterium]|nr:hypothetical protein [Verrucomicrobiales bacterium]
MNPEKQQFLNLKQIPARLTAQEVAWLLGFQPHDIPILLRLKLLKTRASPRANGIPCSPSLAIERLRSDPRWLARASDAIYEHWRKKNGRPAK